MQIKFSLALAAITLAAVTSANAEQSIQGTSTYAQPAQGTQSGTTTSGMSGGYGPASQATAPQVNAETGTVMPAQQTSSAVNGNSATMPMGAGAAAAAPATAAGTSAAPTAAAAGAAGTR